MLKEHSDMKVKNLHVLEFDEWNACFLFLVLLIILKKKATYKLKLKLKTKKQQIFRHNLKIKQ